MVIISSPTFQLDKKIPPTFLRQEVFIVVIEATKSCCTSLSKKLYSLMNLIVCKLLSDEIIVIK
jgi:hypothetical protein